MCNMLVSKEKNNKEFEFIVYNVAFSETRGKFTTEYVYQQLAKHQIQADRLRLEKLFGRWTDLGLIFEDADEYIINTMIAI